MLDDEAQVLSDQVGRMPESRMLLMYTDGQRSADSILAAQSQGTEDRRVELRAMRELAVEMRSVLGQRGDLDEFAGLLGEGWKIKRST